MALRSRPARASASASVAGVALLLGQLAQHAESSSRRRRLSTRSSSPCTCGQPAGDLLRVLLVVPEVGRGHLLAEVRDLAAHRVDVEDLLDGVHRRLELLDLGFDVRTCHDRQGYALRARKRSPAQVSSARRSLMIRASSRDTCIWVTPMSWAICSWVQAWKNRQLEDPAVPLPEPAHRRGQQDPGLRAAVVLVLRAQQLRQGRRPVLADRDVQRGRGEAPSAARASITASTSISEVGGHLARVAASAPGSGTARWRSARSAPAAPGSAEADAPSSRSHGSSA